MASRSREAARPRWARGGDAWEGGGTLVVRDGGPRRLEPGDVRLEGNRDLVTEAPLHSCAHRAEEPGGGGGYAETDGRRAPQTGPVVQHALTEEHQPEREERIW